MRPMDPSRSPAWPPDADWHGWIDPAQLPAVLNPPGGQIVTANNEVDRSLPFVVTRDWVAPFRAQRITELLGDRRGFDVRAMQEIQADMTSRAADWLLKSIELPESVKELQTWDRRVDHRPVALLFEAFEEALWRRTFADELPEPLFGEFYRLRGERAVCRAARDHHGRALAVVRRSVHAGRCRNTPTTSWRARPTMPFRACGGGWASRRTGDGTRLTPSSSRIRWAVAAACSTGSSAGARCRSPATA